MTNGSNPYAPPPPSGGSQEPTRNPYAPPSASIVAEGEVAEAEAVRRQYLKHEASIRSVGCLYLWSGIIALAFAAIGLAVLPFVYMGARAEVNDAWEAIGFYFFAVAIYGVLGGASFWIGKGLRNLDPKVRTVATVVFVIGLIGVPVGTILSLYFLYLLHSEKGKRILTTEYQQIVEQTPHIKYRTSWVAWLVLALFIAALVALVVMAA